MSALPLEHRPDENQNYDTQITTRGPAGSSSNPPPRNTEGPPSPTDRQLAPNNQLSTSPPSSGKVNRICKKCQKPLLGQFVRALGATFHLDCFRCKDCNVVVASKFFPIDDENGGDGQYPLCETDYFRRLDLLCHTCGGALRGSYITAVDRKYHIEHFTCCVCPTVFGPQDSYYEHERQVYCHYHYSTQFASRCHGCQTAILKQFVELVKNNATQYWHPECYMIHKFWSVRLAPQETIEIQSPIAEDPSEARRSVIKETEEEMEEKVYRIWNVLSTFEESSAACISDMLLHVSNGAFVDGVFVAERFISHVEILFASADQLDEAFHKVSDQGMQYSREAKLLCKKIVAFFRLISDTQDGGVRKLGVTQELLSLVTGLAHYLKLLIRISLQGSLRLEKDYQNPDGLNNLLEHLSDMDGVKDSKQSFEATQGAQGEYAEVQADLCPACRKPVEDECAGTSERRWHLACLKCANCERADLGWNLSDAFLMTQDKRTYCGTCAAHIEGEREQFRPITRLKQFIFLLRVALARLLGMLQVGGNLPHTSDDPNLTSYDSSEGYKIGAGGPGLLRSDTRSKSYGGQGGQGAPQPHDEYSDTIENIRRFRSQRLDKQINNSARKARQSRIIEGPVADYIKEGEGENEMVSHKQRRSSQFRVVEDNEPGMERGFMDDKTLTLDDIPRIVAAEQARTQRPNAFKHARASTFNPLLAATMQPKLQNGHQRELSVDTAAVVPDNNNNNVSNNNNNTQPAFRPKRYFSELSAIDYFIVRHIAVLSMEPLVEGHFNLEELLNLIEARKSNFWGRLGKTLKGDAKKGAKKKGVFGVPLETLVERDGADSTMGVGPGTLRIPAMLDDAVVAMRGMDMSVEGVFRKNGNIKRLKALAENIDRGAENIEMNGEGPVQIAALLRKFLRELPDPLLTFKLHKLFITSQKIPDEEKRRRVLHLTCCLLPKYHRDAMEILFAFLNWTASFSHIDEDSGSKMDVHNLATVITPNILYSKSKDAGMEDSFLAIEAVHTLIECNETMCEVPEDILSIMNDTNLFSHNSAELTTKDILKRYGEIINRPTPARMTAPPSAPGSPPRSKDGRAPSTSSFQRVDEDPSQTMARQKEATARHVGGPPQPQQQVQQLPPQQQQQQQQQMQMQHPSQQQQQQQQMHPQPHQQQQQQQQQHQYTALPNPHLHSQQHPHPQKQHQQPQHNQHVQQQAQHQTPQPRYQALPTDRNGGLRQVQHGRGPSEVAVPSNGEQPYRQDSWETRSNNQQPSVGVSHTN